MASISACRSSSHIYPIFILFCLILQMGCGASDAKGKVEANVRDKSCQQAGVTGSALKACKGSEEGYRQVMESFLTRYDDERVARNFSEDQYERVSLDVLREGGCCFAHFTDATEAPKHPLFGKRVVLEGQIVYIPINHEGKRDAHQWLDVHDATHFTTWQVDADIESLSREERTLIRTHCVGGACDGKFYGVIRRIEQAEGLEILGLQIEHMELSQPLTTTLH